MKYYIVSFLLSGLVTLGLTNAVSAQSVTVSGTVVSSEDGEALPAVNISVQGTTTGTQTDVDGQYELTVGSNATLVFSFVGFQTQEVPVQGRSTIDVSLIPQAIVGDELVVVGYGAVQRRDVTGSVSSVSSRDIQEVPVTNITQALQGRAAGVVIEQGGGLPGPGGASIRIRGNRSLNASNNPLYVVDGVPMGDIEDIAPGDIASMEILKDASAAAIYGSRGANGVILITTTRGGNMPTTVSYNATAGYVDVWAEQDMMNANEYMMARCDGMAYANQFQNANYGDPNCAALGTPVTGTGNSRTTSDEWAAFNAGVDTDWKDVLIDGYGFQQDHNLTVRGGDERTQFSLSGNFFFDQGVITDLHDYQRTTFRLNLDHSVTDRLRVGTSTSFARGVNNSGTNPFGSAQNGSPLLTPYDEEGNLRVQLDPLVYNPLLDLQPGAVLDETISLRVFSNIFAEYNLMDNLSYRLSFAPDIRNERNGEFYSSLSTARQLGEPQASKRHSDNFDYTLINQLNYNETFADIHSVNFTGVFEISRERNESTNITARDMPYESQFYHNLGTAPNIQNYGSGLSESGILSYMGRVVYNLMDKYSVTLTGRYDGSSRFAEGNRFGFFPSVALGWRMIEEPFFANQSLLSDLRLRVSYGMVGNQAIGPYQTRGGLSRTTYSFNDGSAFGYRPGSIANPDLRWETSTSLNLGLDFGLWSDRVVGSVEVYEVNTTDLLLSRQLPITSGFGSITTNLGETRNRGWEVTLQSRNVATQNFNWTTDLNLFSNREEIVELYGEGFDDIGNGWFIGQPLNVTYNYEFGGIWQVDETAEAATYGKVPGEIKIVDQDGNGNIDGDDRVILGQSSPKFNFGFNNRFSYRGLDLGIFVFGRTGDLINYNPSNSLQIRYNNRDVNYWTVDNPNNEQPAVHLLNESPDYSGTQAYYPGDFLKVRNIQLGYTVPSRHLSGLGIRSLRLQANVTTPFTMHRLPSASLDPERAGSSTPTTRTYQLGINIDF